MLMQKIKITRSTKIIGRGAYADVYDLGDFDGQKGAVFRFVSCFM
jgi:hypothetical protein